MKNILLSESLSFVGMGVLLIFLTTTFAFAQTSNTIFGALEFSDTDEYIQMHGDGYGITDALPVEDEEIFHNSAEIEEETITAEEVLEYAQMHEEKLEQAAQEKEALEQEVFHNSAGLTASQLPAFLPETGASL